MTPIRKTSIWHSSLLWIFVVFVVHQRNSLHILSMPSMEWHMHLEFPIPQGVAQKNITLKRWWQVLHTTNLYAIEINSRIIFLDFIYSHCLDKIQTNRGWKKMQRIMFPNVPTWCTTYCKGCYQYPLEFCKDYKPYF